MRIAFYAPMKSPSHPAPSGDRRLARLLLEALRLAGHEVEIASEFRAYDGSGQVAAQAAIRDAGEQQASQLIAAYHDGSLARPQLWFTYHLYHKAPDWIGPRVAQALEIPYLVAEASYAGKQRGGPWDMGLEASRQALAAAAAVISFNPVDDAGISPWLRDGVKIYPLPPFIDTAPYAAAAGEREGENRL